MSSSLRLDSLSVNGSFWFFLQLPNTLFLCFEECLHNIHSNIYVQIIEIKFLYREV